MRPIQLATGEIYHIYNRGVDKRKVFLRYGHYLRFIKTMRLILDTGSATKRAKKNQSVALKSNVSILSYCLMPNHYHVLIKQTDENGITDFMHKLDTSYTKYFIMNQVRTGCLFESTFKSKHIDSEELLMHVSRYIHLNPFIANITQYLEEYAWSSYIDFIGLRKGTLCDKYPVLSLFSNNPEKYKKFVIDHAKYMQREAMNSDEDSFFL